MDRNTLLKSSRSKFVSIFTELIEGVVHRSIEALYRKADKCLNSQEQRRILDARDFIVRNEKTLVGHIVTSLETLLDRSFETAYDQFRPSFFNTAAARKIELLDISTFEDDLRLDLITSQFRNEAGEQLRDLNIRIAILFECNNIAERENPFRPYLLTRSIVLGVEAMHVEPKSFVIVTDQLAEELLLKVVKLYEGVNAELSDAGVAAQLQFKPQRTSSDMDNATDDDSLVALMQVRQALMPNSLPAADFAHKNAELAVSNQFARIEHLLNTIKLRQPKQTQQKSQTQAPIIDFPEINLDLLESSIFPPNKNNTGTVGHLMDQAGATVSAWLDGVQEVGDALRRVFSGGTRRFGGDEKSDITQLPEKSTSPVISSKLDNALRCALPPMDEMMGVDGEVRNLLIESRDSLNSLASDQHEKMTIDIVAMLFEFILKDHQVPAEVRAQLGRLQFSVLKMALLDPDLLTKKSHPVRLLVNRIGSISVRLQQIDPTGERISAEICLIVDELLTNDADNPELFNKMLDQLDIFIARELLTSSTKIGNAANVVSTVEQRIQRFGQTSVVLEKILDEITVTTYLRQFLLDTWLHVIERVERDKTVDSTRFRLLVPDLLWSVFPKTSQDDRTLLAKIIPTLVSVLRDGMRLIEWSLEQQQEFLNWLVDAHTTAVRDVPGDDTNTEKNTGVVLSLVDLQNRFHDFIYPDDTGSPVLTSPSKIKVQRSFIDEAVKELETELTTAGMLENLDLKRELFSPDGLLDDMRQRLDNVDEVAEVDIKGNAGVDLAQASPPESVYSEEESVSDFSRAMNGTREAEASEETDNNEDILDRLRSGVVVEINLSGTPTVGRLNWISPNSTNLILTMSEQHTPSIISVRMFRRMLKNSRARFVEVAPLFERAVQSLLESADLVDLTHST